MTRQGRRLAFGLATVLGLASRGFFIPYRYAGGVSPAGYPGLEPLFEAAEPAIKDVLEAIETWHPALDLVGSRTGALRLDQDWFPRLDAMAAYAMVRLHRPLTIIEVGSGHSTRFLARAIADAGLGTRLVCIDPAPRAALGQLPVEHLPVLLEQADPALFGTLQPGDALFIDSSHIAMPGTDVDRLFLDILPRLAPGVLVHVHDILLPDAYPADWAWRGYNEQLVVGTLLQGGGYALAFSSHWAATRMAAATTVALGGKPPATPGVVASSLWLQKRGG